MSPPLRSHSVSESRPSPWAALVAATLGLIVAVGAFSLRGSPLYQSASIWKGYNSLFGPPIALWLLERCVHQRRVRRWAFVIDAAVVLLVAARSRGLIPIASGHGLMFAFILLTTRGRATHVITAIALLAATAVKVLAWRNGLSVLAGVAVGAAFAIAWQRASRSPRPA